MPPTHERVLIKDNRTVWLRSYQARWKPNTLDKVYDCRSLPNPWSHAELRALPGTHPDIMKFVAQKEKFSLILFPAVNLIDSSAQPGVEWTYGDALRVGFICVGGRHRSVAMVEHVANYLVKERGWLDKTVEQH